MQDARERALHKAARPADGARRASGDRALRRQGLAEDVEDVAIRFLLEPVGRRHMDRPTVLRTQCSPAGWHGRLGGGVQADAMTGRLVHGAARIDLGDVNVRKLLSKKKWRYAPAKRVIRKRRGHRYGKRETCDAHVAK